MNNKKILDSEKMESSFDITEPVSLMQRGLPASYRYTDYIYVVDDWSKA
jgi:hypothetical protein